MDIKTMSVNVEDKTIAINGEGYVCTELPPVDSNVISMQWHPEKQGRCKGSISRHVGGGEGIDDFALLQPFVKTWQDARERTLSRKAMEVAEALGDFSGDVPTEDPVDDDPLPRMFQKAPEPSVAPEMQANLEDFERRVAEVQKRSIAPVSDDLASRVAALEEFRVEINQRFDALNAQIAASFEKLGGKT